MSAITLQKKAFASYSQAVHLTPPDAKKMDLLYGAIVACEGQVPASERTSSAYKAIQFYRGEVEALRKSLLPALSLPPPVAGGPIGLQREGMNCWANALLQLVAHTPSLQAEPLSWVVQTYEEARERKTPPEGWLTQQLRLLLADKNALLSPSADRQEDADEALSILLDLLPHGSPLFTRMRHQRQFAPAEGKGIPHGDPNAYSCLDEHSCTSEEQPECRLYIDLQDRGHLSFEQLLESSLCNVHPYPTEANYRTASGAVRTYRLAQERRQFACPPQELFLNLKRFGYHQQRKEIFKIHTAVNIPLGFTLPAAATLSGEIAHYALEAAIIHDGETPRSGHYTALVQREGRWFHCNDASVRQVSAAELAALLKRSYIHYYRRVSSLPAEMPLSSSPRIAQLQRFLADLHSHKPQEELKQAFYALDDWAKLHGLVWKAHGEPQRHRYGQEATDADVRVLLNRNPVLNLAGSLVEQWIAHLEQEEIREQEKEERARLQAFYNGLRNRYTSHGELMRLFDALTPGIRDKLALCVWLADKCPDELGYGEKRIRREPRYLLEISTPLIADVPNKDLVAQLMHLLK